MPAESTQELMTAEQLATVDMPGKSLELIRGRLVVREPPFTDHGIVSGNLLYFLSVFVRKNKLGVVCAQDTGFKIESNPDTVRAPDVAYLSKDRASAVNLRSYAAVAPDLAAEVVSASDRRGELLSKVGAWLEAGTRLVWVIDPKRNEARVHRPDGSITIIAKNGVLEGEDVLPGFSCPLSDVLEVGLED